MDQIVCLIRNNDCQNAGVDDHHRNKGKQMVANNGQYNGGGEDKYQTDYAFVDLECGESNGREQKSNEVERNADGIGDDAFMFFIYPDGPGDACDSGNQQAGSGIVKPCSQQECHECQAGHDASKDR